MQDRKVLRHIQELMAEEDRLYNQGHISDEERAQLEAVQVELDQCWDLLRQREALRAAGKNPDQATVRSPNIVENYLQ